MKEDKFSVEVTQFLDSKNHPMRDEIEYLRRLILNTELDLVESIKWNGPNYSLKGEDRVTFRINPPNQIQLIFHRGAKVKEPPKERLLNDEHGILTWKEKDRAIISFHNLEEIEKLSLELQEIVVKWFEATT